MKQHFFKLMLVALVISLFATFTLAACQVEPTEPADPTVKTVEITDKATSLNVGDTYKFVAKVTMTDGTTNATVTWDSSNKQIATVDADGTVHALAAGTTNISAAAGEKNASVQLTVAKAEEEPATVKSVQITDKVTSLTEGQTHKFVATVNMSDGTTDSKATITWDSSDKQVATVDADGTVHALAAGTTNITASSGGKSDSVALTVTAAAPVEVPPTSITLSNEDLSDGELYLTIGDDPVDITVTVLPAEATNKAYTYKLEGEEEGIVSVAAKDDGTGYTVTALKVGEVKLVVTSSADEKVKAECTIYVDPVAVTDLQINPASIGGESKFYQGDKQTVTVTVSPENATDKTYKYELSKDNVVKVTAVEGGYEVEALSVGDVTLTITSNGNEAAVATCQITVSAKVVESIEMETEITVEVGEFHQLTATLKPEGVVDTLTWSVKPEGVVSVQDGKVTALTPGEATVEVQSGNGKTASCKVIVPKHLTAMSIPAKLTVYTGEGAQPRDIEVNYTPADATYKDFEIALQQEGEVISAVKGEGKITVTGLKTGEATLTITSADKKATDVTATCQITVKDISEAVPYVSKDAVTVDIQASEVIQVLSDSGDITNVTVSNSYTSVVTASAKKSDEGVWNVTITGVKFSHASITVKATVAGKVTNIPVTVTVAADYFYITGNFDGTEWVQYNTEDEARDANVLMTKTSDTTWEISREFLVDEKLFVLPANLDTNWDNALRSESYYSATNSTYVSQPDKDNAQVKFKGNYTVKLTLSTSGASWTVKVNYFDITAATLKSDAPSITYGAEDQDVLISLTVQPSYAQSYITSLGSVTYTVDEQYKDWFTITPNEGNKFSCTFALTKFEGEEEVEVKITAKITVKEYSYTAEYTLTVMPEGAKETPVTEVNFDKDGPIYVNVASGWTYTVHATVNKDATVQGVKYSLATGSSTKYNDSTTMAFTIDATTGKITAKQFGLIKVRATSEGKNAEGKAVTKDIEILFYSDNLMITGSYYKHDSDSWDSNTLKYTTKDNANYTYSWTGLELHTGDKLVFIYSTADWDHGVMRTLQYHGTDSPSGYGVSATTDSANGGYTVKKDGIYTIKLDLKQLVPKITFTKTADIATSDTWSYTVSLYLNYVNTWKEGIASVTSQKITQDNPTVSLAYNFTDSTIKAPSSSAAAKFNWAYSVGTSGKKYLNQDTNTIKYTGACSTTWTSSTKWYNWKSGTQGNDELQYVSSAGLKNSYWTFTFTFDSTGKPTTCNIASGNQVATASMQSQSVVTGLNVVVLDDFKHQGAVVNAVPTNKFYM